MDILLKWAEKILTFIKDYGYINILKSWVIIILFAFTSSILFNFKGTIATVSEVVSHIEETKHANNKEIRKRINPIVNALLDRALIEIDCDRAFIMEGHNGKANTSGLGFEYADMTYERCKKISLESSIYWQYNNMPTSIFPFFDYLDHKRYFSGTIDDISTVDLKLAQMIKNNGTNYMVAIEIPGKNTVSNFVGILGFSFQNTPIATEEKLKEYAIEICSKLQMLLSATSVEELDSFYF